MTKKHRSPSYPAVGLEQAIGLAGRLYPGGKHLLGASVIAEEWGYKGLNSASPYIAALKHFGLLQEEKIGGDRMLKLTPRAIDIITDRERESEECDRALRDAAIEPTLHRELWEKWNGELPPDKEIRRYLERERSFNPNSVDQFIEQLKATLAFSGLLGNDKISDKDKAAQPNQNQIDASDLFGWTSPAKRQEKTNQQSTKMRELPITLPSLGIAVIRVPERMSQQDYTFLESTLKLWKNALVVSSPEAPACPDVGEDEDE